MQGEKSTEEQAMLERKISELQVELERKRDDHTMLTSQTRQIEEEKRRLQKYLNEIDRDKKSEQKKIEELELHADNAQRLIRKLNDEKEVGLEILLFLQKKKRNLYLFFLRIYLLTNI
jgi:pyrroloquinoline quinone (PQQ) biosynthesis protein C